MSPQLTAGLWYAQETASSSIAQVARNESGVIEPVLRFRRGSMNAQRVHIDLVLLGGDRSVDVSFHPAATLDFVRSQARRRQRDANGWVGALLAALLTDAERWGAWAPTPGGPPRPPLAVLGGITHPLLGGAFDAGVAAVAEVPRWASLALAESAVAASSVRLFGPEAAVPSVVRALARFLVTGPEVRWWQLAACVAAVAADARSDDLVTLLGAPVSASSATTPPTEPPTGAEVAVLRRGLALVGAERSKRLVLDAMDQDGEVGVVRLTRSLQQLLDAPDEVRWPPPVRLVDLESACLRATAVDPGPAAVTLVRQAFDRYDAVERCEATVPTPRPRPVRPGWATPRNAPPTRSGPPPPSTWFQYDADARRLDRVAIGDLELVLPRTPDELAMWGRMLDNCLASFAAAVADAVTTIVGVRQRGALLAALEVRLDERRVVQFLGPGNRRPSAAVSGSVLRHLAARGVIR